MYDRKLAMIARLTREELSGWIWAREIDKRELFDGEVAAIADRARVLGCENMIDGLKQSRREV